MSKKAMCTSRKRVEAILRVREAQIRSDERKRSGIAFASRTLGSEVQYADRDGDVWLGPRPERRYLDLDLIGRNHRALRDADPANIVTVVRLHVMPWQIDLENGARLRWVGWELESVGGRDG